MSIQDIFGRLSFDAATRIRTWKKLAMQAQYGLPLKDSLGILRDQAQRRNPALARIFGQVLDHMGSGHHLDTALTGYASPEEIMLIASGQKAGKLPDGLRMAAELLEARRRIVGAVAGALAYPLFLFLMASAMLAIVALYVMPELVQLSDPRAWTGFARGLYLISALIGSWGGIVLLAALVGGCVVLVLMLPLWTGPARKIADRFPPWSMYRLTVGGVWLFTLSTLMRSGMQLSHILNTMLASENTSPYLRERIRAISNQVGRGENIGEAMYLCNLDFPDRELIDDFRTYAGLPHFKDQLQDFARDWLQEGIAAIQRKARLLNLAFLMLIIGQMLLIAMSVMDLQSQLSTPNLGVMK